MLRKIYGSIKASVLNSENQKQLWKALNISENQINELETWWQQEGRLSQKIASSSDRVNLESKNDRTNLEEEILLRHPISGQKQKIKSQSIDISSLVEQYELNTLNHQQLFYWLWRFLPEIQAQQGKNILTPANSVLPDCPSNSYASTVSALIGSMYPENKETEALEEQSDVWQKGEKPFHPYLILFTFSPVQEFIKASRKFLDFWSSSYLLHYLGAKVCWFIAQEYGPDSVITPSLWGQEIIDALILKQLDIEDVFKNSFTQIIGFNPIDRFNDRESNSLATAGFPNVITALVPSKQAAEKLGKKLQQELKKEWQTIAYKVRDDIKQQVIKYLEDENEPLWEKIKDDFPSTVNLNPYQHELNKWKTGGCWEWNKLWQAQIDNTWETYWTAIPLGNPEQPLSLENLKQQNIQTWKEAQETIANPRTEQIIPTPAEEEIYLQFNVGTWWGAIQARLGQSIQAVKNTRSWQIPPAPGERSTLSGQFSALHPAFNYNHKYREGAGKPESSMRLFWRVMAEVYPGLFNGTEKLNAIEITKRMAWIVGGVAESLGITEENITDFDSVSYSDSIDYEALIRFPNASSIASARFMREYPQKAKNYWRILNKSIATNLNDKRDLFASSTRGRPLHITQADRAINPQHKNGDNYNGVMFSSKWLAEDLNLTAKANKNNPDNDNNQNELSTLRSIVDSAHKESGFGDTSPADWWVIVLGDGDSMGKYVSGRKLKNYQEYLISDLIDEEIKQNEKYADLLTTKKRMGPATHVGLNRALLDFSNRLVPYLTEKRFCGKVVYSGGDDVMAVLPLADLPEYLLSIRAAWSGKNDPYNQFATRQNTDNSNDEDSGYWIPKQDLEGLQNDRPYFTMGKDATMSLGVVIAHKSVPLPTVLETLWSAEKERAKKITGKDGLCFRVIYGSGNVLEALMKGSLLPKWWSFVRDYRFKTKKELSAVDSEQIDLSPLLHRLAEELPRHACITPEDKLIVKAAQVIIDKRDSRFTTPS